MARFCHDATPESADEFDVILMKSKTTKVLILEPDLDIAGLLKQYFKRFEYLVVESVQSAEEAIRSADKKRPDAVVMEFAIAENNGIAFLHEFRSYEDWQNIPVIVHTHMPFKKYLDQPEIKRLNIAEYLYKPTTTFADLSRALNRVCGH